MPYTTPLADTLLVGSTDLQALNGVVFGEGALDGLAAPVLRRGTNVPVPRKPGEPATKKPIAAFSFTIHVIVSTTTETDDLLANRASAWVNYSALIVACLGDDGVVALTRRLTASASTHKDMTAAGEFIGAANFQWADLETIEADLQFNQTDGRWWDAVAVAWIVP